MNHMYKFPQKIPGSLRNVSCFCNTQKHGHEPPPPYDATVKKQRSICNGIVCSFWNEYPNGFHRIDFSYTHKN